MSKIVIAIPRGRITKECKNLLLKTSFAPDPLLFDKDTRKLTFKSKKRNIEYIKVRAFDACTFVAFGAAQIGIAGEDVINEFDYSEIYAPLDLNIGHCRISVAALKSLLKKEDPETWSNIRIATKYPNITKKFFYNNLRKFNFNNFSKNKNSFLSCTNDNANICSFIFRHSIRI